jgi:glyoxylase-like metal-dependent hydrolase (beta-lactamase superfamily II)
MPMRAACTSQKLGHPAIQKVSHETALRAIEFRLCSISELFVPDELYDRPSELFLQGKSIMKPLHLMRSLAFATFCSGSTLPIAAHVHAAAPLVKTAAPGFYRMMLGEFEVTALSDGTIALPVNQLLTNVTQKKVEEALAKHYLKSPLETSINAYLINTGSKLVLIDTGAGSLFGPTAGNLATSLIAAGYQPDQVDEIYVTHIHGDHIGGLLNGDKPAFPNAIVRVDKRDADFWLSRDNMEKAPAAMKTYFQSAMTAIDPYIKANRFQPFNGNTDLAPGIKAVATYGHTKGHTAYMVESKGNKLALLGDLIHVAAVQFENPEVTIQFDTDQKAAAAQRSRVFANAVKGGYLVGAAHLSFPGIGHIRKQGKGYVFEAVNYSPVR